MDFIRRDRDVLKVFINILEQISSINRSQLERTYAIATEDVRHQLSDEVKNNLFSLILQHFTHAVRGEDLTNNDQLSFFGVTEDETCLVFLKKGKYLPKHSADLKKVLIKEGINTGFLFYPDHNRSRKITSESLDDQVGASMMSFKSTQQSLQEFSSKDKFVLKSEPTDDSDSDSGIYFEEETPYQPRLDQKKILYTQVSSQYGSIQTPSREEKKEAFPSSSRANVIRKTSTVPTSMSRNTFSHNLLGNENYEIITPVPNTSYQSNLYGKPNLNSTSLVNNTMASEKGKTNAQREVFEKLGDTCLHSTTAKKDYNPKGITTYAQFFLNLIKYPNDPTNAKWIKTFKKDIALEWTHHCLVAIREYYSQF